MLRWSELPATRRIAISPGLTPRARALSPDGQTLLFTETGLGGNYDVCLRKTDGSPVVRLGEGWAADLSADGKWALAIIQSHPPQLVIYPTGAGQTQQLKRGAIENYSSAQWFPDGKSVLIGGNESGRGPRFYIQHLGAEQEAQPVTPEGTRDGWLSSDGRLVLGRGPENRYFIHPIVDGDPRPLTALSETDILSQWSADQRSALVYRRAQVPCRLERVDLASGRRTLFKEFAPADRTGLLSMRESHRHRRPALLRLHRLLPGFKPVRFAGREVDHAFVAALRRWLRDGIVV